MAPDFRKMNPTDERATLEDGALADDMPPGDLPPVSAGDGGEQPQNLKIQDELKDSYLSYAMSVIISRALPDVRDGLKPSQRRILLG